MFILKKLAVFATPLGFSWLLLGAWLVWRVFRRQTRGLLLPVSSWLVLTFFTCTPVTSFLMRGLENQFPRIKPEDAPSADAVICLGGGAEPSLSEPTGAGFNGSADRLTTSLALLGAGKAPALIVAGGDYRDKTRRYSEADAVVDWLKQAVKPAQEVISLGICADTHDEALKVADIARQRGWKQLLLVTSASHMKRAHATFVKAGLQVRAVPCDYVSSFNRIGSVRWLHLPGSGQLTNFEAWMHEQLGLLLYWLRGWI
jgi:uncharacterized SAM-binding protein YcdF (DUF218 family)